MIDWSVGGDALRHTDDLSIAELRRASVPDRLQNALQSVREGWKGSETIRVLGPHRSGTSPVNARAEPTRREPGCSRGFDPARADNPTGFWEHSGLVYIHERIVAHFWSVEGVTGEIWRDPPVFHEGWENSPAMRAIAWRAALMLRMHFRAADLLGWKDARPDTAILAAPNPEYAT